jgi:hypothetical protein
VSVAELDWTQRQHYAALSPPPFDYVLAADCIYHETLLRHLYRVMLAITNERSTSEHSCAQNSVMRTSVTWPDPVAPLMHDAQHGAPCYAHATPVACAVCCQPMTGSHTLSVL